MNNLKRLILVLVGIIVIAIILFFIYFYFFHETEEVITEYTPEEEISQEQVRQTMVSLYFKKEKELIPEARLIDVKELITNPYETLINMLIEGPKNENLEKTIPGGTSILGIEKQGEILVIDFSKEFIENHPGGEEEEKLTINSIVNTVTELTEINGVKIKIEGEENKSFQDGKINFENNFTRENN